MSEKVKELTRKITSATEGELLVITYDLLRDSIEKLEVYASEKDREAYAEELKYYNKVVKYLIETLELSNQLAVDLYRLYGYVSKLLIQASISMDVSKVKEAKQIVEILYKGFYEIKDASDKAVMQNNQRVYAGLTYGKDDLNEYVEDNHARGYKV